MKKTSRVRKASQVALLSHWFVTTAIGREMLPEDYRGLHVRHAKLLLKDYDLIEIVRCLQAAKVGAIGEIGDFRDLMMVVRGEPPLMELWRQYRDHPPAPWLERPREVWAEITCYDPFRDVLTGSDRPRQDTADRPE